MKKEDKIALSNIRFERASEFLKDAEIALKNKRYSMSTSRSYYAVFHGILSLLILEGASPLTHAGLKTLFNLKFIKTGLINKNFSKYLKELYERRSESDYGDFLQISKEEANDSFKKAKIFLKEIDKLRKKLIESL